MSKVDPGSSAVDVGQRELREAAVRSPEETLRKREEVNQKNHNRTFMLTAD